MRTLFVSCVVREVNENLRYYSERGYSFHSMIQVSPGVVGLMLLLPEKSA